MTASWNVQRLLAPHEPLRFFGEDWTHRPVLIQGSDDKFTSLLDGQRFVELLKRYRETRDPRRPHVELFRGAKPVSLPDDWKEVVGGARWGNAFHERVRGARNVTTIRCRHVYAIDAKLHDLARSVFTELGEPPSVNAYYSVAGSSGVAPHYDRGEVFVLQIEGEKLWHVDDEKQSSPSRRGEELTSGKALPLEYRLTKGDVLYIPGNHAHWAETPGPQPSVHVTVQVQCHDGATVLDWLTETLRDPAALDENLPLVSELTGDSVAGRSARQKRFEAIVAACRELLERPDRFRDFEMYLFKDDAGRFAAPLEPPDDDDA